MAARVFQFPNVVRGSRGAAVKQRVVAPDDFATPQAMARILNEAGEAIRALKAFVRPPYVEFEDLALPGAAGEVTLPHNFGGRVRWWVTDWFSAAAAAPILRKSEAKTTNDVLVLLSSQVGTATIRVEALP